MKQHNNAAGVMGRVKKVLRRRYQHQVLLSRNRHRQAAQRRDCAGLYRFRASAFRL
ncbi:hypothetical protein ACVXG8_25710 [Escherichia coli]